MANNASFVIREIQIKTPMRYLYTTIRMAKIKNLTKMQSNWNSYILLVRMQNSSVILKNSLGVSDNVNICFSCDPTSPLLDIYPKEIKTYVHMKICMLLAAL